MSAWTRDRIVELFDREIAKSVAYERIRARCMAIWANGRVDATPPVHAHVCEGRRFGGRRQRRDEQHTRNAMDHRRYPDGGAGRCQPTKDSHPNDSFSLGNRRARIDPSDTSIGS